MFETVQTHNVENEQNLNCERCHITGTEPPALPVSGQKPYEHTGSVTFAPNGSGAKWPEVTIGRTDHDIEHHITIRRHTTRSHPIAADGTGVHGAEAQQNVRHRLHSRKISKVCQVRMDAGPHVRFGQGAAKVHETSRPEH